MQQATGTHTEPTTTESGPLGSSVAPCYVLLDELLGRKKKLTENILSIQSRLGTERSFDRFGNLLTPESRSRLRLTLKTALTRRQTKKIKLEGRIQVARAEVKEYEKNNPKPAVKKINKKTTLVSMAFALLCDDIAKGKSPLLSDDGQIASIYLTKAAEHLSGT